jgi:hypothetical protein
VSRKKATGGGGARNPNSLANLRPNPDKLVPGAGAWRPGVAPHLEHGLRSRDPSPEVIDPVLDLVLDDLETKVPIRDEHGQVPPWLREMAWSAAIAKLQVIRCSRYLAQHGDTDAQGRLRPEVEALSKTNDRYQRSLERLAMTVPSHMRSGLDAARTVDSASAMSAPDDKRRVELLREAGLDPEEEG